MKTENKNQNCFVFLSHGDAGGIATYQAQQIKHLLSNGEMVILIDKQPESTLSNQCLKSKNIGYVGVLNADVWGLPFQAFSYIKNLSKTFKGVFIFVSNPSLLFFWCIFLCYLRHKKNVKVFLTLHSKMVFKRLFLKLFGENLTSLLIYFFSNKIIFVSNYTKQYWERYPLIRKSNSIIIGNSIEPNLSIKYKKRAQKLRVAFVGRLSSDKDPELFCLLAEESHQRGLKLTFSMFGDGVLFEKLRLKYSKFVIFHGWLSEEKIYSECDLLIITSPIENSPYALLEAKNYGIPVIARKCGGLPEIVTCGSDGFLVEHWSNDLVLDLISIIDEKFLFYSNSCLENRLLHTTEKSWIKLNKLITQFS